MNKTEKPTRGRPAGQTKANGYAVSPGRPAAAKGEQYPFRLQEWRAWWPTRPRTLTLAVAAERLQKTSFTLSRWASTHEPPEVELGNLERLSAAYGYAPPTDHYKFL